MSEPRLIIATDSASVPRKAANFRWGAAAMAVAAAISAGCWLVYDPLYVMNDATEAISVGRHLAAGEGLRTSIIYYEEQYASGEVPAPQTVFPPGYPALIAAVTLLGVPVDVSACIVVSVCMAVVAALLLLTGRRMGLSLAAALLATLCWCACIQGWQLTRSMMSEMPFIACTLFSLLLFPDVDRPSRGRVFLSGCAAAIAFTMRYAGVFWFMTVAGFFAFALRSACRRNLQLALAWGSIPLVTLTTLFWRNHVLSGEWTGGNAIGNHHTLWLTLREMYYSFSQLVGLSRSQLMDGGPAELLIIAAMVGGAVWLIGNRRHLSIDRSRLAAVTGSPRIRLSTGYIVVTMALLVILDMRSPIGLGPRKLLPVLPFALLVMGAASACLTIEIHRARRLLIVPAVVFGLGLAFGQANVLGYLQERQLASRMIATALAAQVTDTAAKDETLQAFLSQHIRDDAPLLANECHQVFQLIDRPVLGLPSPRYTDRVFTTEEVRRIVGLYNVEYVAIFRQALLRADFLPPFFEALDAGDVPDWLTPRLQHENVLLFSVVRGDSDQGSPAPPTDAAVLSQTTVRSRESPGAGF